MAHFDVFNGDADGICALHQLRLAEPCPDANLITGFKRDTRLLDQITPSAEDSISVLDISLDTNRASLERILASGAKVLYFDHHFAGEKPFAHPSLVAHIDTASDICTSLIVDRWLHGQFRLWAVTGAFGDNLHRSAHIAADKLGLDAEIRQSLQTLGECLNYNGYGESLNDLWFHPAELYEAIRPYLIPQDFIQEAPAFRKLYDGYKSDLKLASELHAVLDTPHAAAFELPDAPWARRISGILANQLAHANPDRAHAVLTPTTHNTYTVSIRSPLNRPQGADSLCRQFPNGGGRAAAAGINSLAVTAVADLLDKLNLHFRPS